MAASPRLGSRLKKTSRNKNAGGGGGGLYGARFTPPKADERTTPLLLFRGAYKVSFQLPNGKVRADDMDYDIICEHYSKAQNTGTTCSAGLYEDSEGFILEGNEPCVPCYYWKENGDKGLRPQKKHIFNGVLLANFHLVDSKREIKKDGKGTGKYYQEYVDCLGRRCPHCKEGNDPVFGRTVFLALGTKFVQQLADFDFVTLASECACGGTLEPVGFVCRHCDAVFVDLEQTDIPDERINYLREEEITCKNCGETDLLEEVSACNECSNPKPLNMWNTVIELYRSGEGVNTTLMVKKYRPVTDEELALIKERELMAPLETGRIYKPLSPAAQAKKFNLELPEAYKDLGGGRGSVDWDD